MQYELKGCKMGGPSLPITALNVEKMQEAVDVTSRRGISSHKEVILPEHTPISRQVGGSCVANAFVDGLEILQGISDPSSVTQLSRLAAYSWSRARHGAQLIDDGTYPFYMAQQLNLVGVVLEKDWPNEESKINVPPPTHLIMRASNNRIEAIHEIEGSAMVREDSTEWSLRGGMPVVIALPVHLDVFSQASPNSLLGAPSKVDGYHAMIVVGVRILNNGDRHFRLRNSWGEDWGDGGHVWIDSSYFKRSTDLYMLTLMKGLVTT